MFLQWAQIGTMPCRVLICCAESELRDDETAIRQRGESSLSEIERREHDRAQEKDHPWLPETGNQDQGQGTHDRDHETLMYGGSAGE